jgi:hypothetical protein
MVVCCWAKEAFIFAGYRSYSIGREGHLLTGVILYFKTTQYQSFRNIKGGNGKV